MKKTLILHHSADLDGILSGVIANYYLSHRKDDDNDIIVHHGADYGDNLDIHYKLPNGEYIPLSYFDEIYVLDFSDKWLFESEHSNKIIWIDHHIHAINDRAKNQYRLKDHYLINGVAACRLVQQYMTNLNNAFLDAQSYINREVTEPFMVTLAGEYDIWDRKSMFAIPFNFGVCCNLSFDYVDFLYRETKSILSPYKEKSKETDEELLINPNPRLKFIIECGKAVVDNIQRTSSILGGGVPIEINGMRGRAFNTHIRSYLTHILQGDDKFIMVWNYTGSSRIKCSFYCDEGTDVSVIARYFGGGGHVCACGCQIDIHTLTHILTKPYVFIQ